MVFFGSRARSAFFLSMALVGMRCVVVSLALVNRAVRPAFHCLHAWLRRRRASAVRGIMTLGALGCLVCVDSYSVRVSVARRCRVFCGLASASCTMGVSCAASSAANMEALRVASLVVTPVVEGSYQGEVCVLSEEAGVCRSGICATCLNCMTVMGSGSCWRAAQRRMKSA